MASPETASTFTGQMQALLTRAPRSASLTPRFFRTVSQFVACYERMCVVMISTTMCSHAVMQAHLATVLRIAESSSSVTGGAHLATLYDDLMRRHFMWRAHRHDQTLDILKEVQEPCK